MRTAAATIAGTSAAGVVGLVPSGATDVDTRMADGPQITAGPPRGVTEWRNGPSFDVILTKARADGWEVKALQTLQEAKLATIVRGPISAAVFILENGDGSANVIRDKGAMNFRRRGAAIVGGAIGFAAVTLRRRHQRPPTMPAPRSTGGPAA